MSDSFQTIEDVSTVELKEKGSRFLGVAFPCSSEPEAAERLADVRRMHHSATHHCSAWSVGNNSSVIERFDDDG